VSDGPFVLDASALLAVLQSEPGAARVAELLPRASVSAVNLSEVVAKLQERGMPDTRIRVALDDLDLDIRAFDLDDAYAAGELRGPTRALGLSFGDRACLALAIRLHATAATGDRAWTGVIGGSIRVELIR